MPVNTKRVFYVRYLAHGGYADLLATRPDVRLDKLENDSEDQVATPILAAAHGYQVGAARDELASKYHVHRDLLRRTPNLLIVSSNGAGYDTVDVAACTQAGVLVVNQAGGNAEIGRRARAGDAALPVEAHHRDRPGDAPPGRHRTQCLHEHRSFRARPSASSASATSAAAWPSSAAACCACACSPTIPISPPTK